MSNRAAQEIKTVGLMIELFCRHRGDALCADCRHLLQYTEKRIRQCAFGPDKPVCSRCRVHCFQPEMRRRIREIMRYSGPKMLYRHPWHALRHLIHKHRSS